MTPTPDIVVARLFARSHQDGDCLVSDYSRGSHGYAQIGWSLPDGRSATRLAHRVAWEAVHGPIPLHLTIDHLCRNRPCFNVDHLRLLTNAENARDNGQARRTHCPRGHPYTGDNLYVQPNTGGRRCRLCARLLDQGRR